MLGAFLTKIHIHFIISNAQSTKTFLKIAVLIKLDEIVANSLYCRTVKWADSTLNKFCEGYFFGLYWVFFQVLGIIHLNMLNPIHIKNFGEIWIFLKTTKMSFDSAES